MSVDHADDRAAFFHADDFGVAATYRPASGPDVAVTVVLDRPTADAPLFGGAARAPALAALLNSDGLADDPREGDRITVTGRTYRVRAAQRDISGATWRLSLGE